MAAFAPKAAIVVVAAMAASVPGSVAIWWVFGRDWWPSFPLSIAWGVLLGWGAHRLIEWLRRRG